MNRLIDESVNRLGVAVLNHGRTTVRPYFRPSTFDLRLYSVQKRRMRSLSLRSASLSCGCQKAVFFKASGKYC